MKRIVTQRTLVDADSKDAAIAKYTDNRGLANLAPEIGDRVDDGRQSELAAQPYQDEDEPPQEPMTCPTCGSEEIESDRPEQDQNILFRSERCENCGASWTCEFVFARYEMD